jgi:hypothetical protein
MSASVFASRFLLAALALAPIACSQSAGDDTATSDNHLTSVNAAQRGIHFQSYVYVPTTASDSDIQTAIARQVKTAIGALRQPEVSINDRDAQNNLDPSTWTRQTVTLVDPTNASAATSQLQRVTYPYNDVAVVTNSLQSSSAVAFTMLAGDYSSYATQLIQNCSDDTTTDEDSLWYHYTPTMSSCASLIDAELTAIQTETTALAGDATKVGPHEANRWFMPVTAKLDPPQIPGKSYSPEYDRLYGIGTDKSQVLVYAFFGVDTDETNPDDILGQEAINFLRTMLNAQPNFRPVATDPQAMLEDVYVDGLKIANVTYAKMFSWILDKTNYPPEVGTDANKIAELRKNTMAIFTERKISWDLPVTVTSASGSKNMTIEVRTFYGYEDGSDDIRQHAEWRYLEAFWYGDVFMYNGHSHFGHGPLEPFLYNAGNFNANYQIMLVNSCISYNYYHEDFFSMKPGGTKNLDMVLNGLPAYVNGMGIATAGFLDALIDGKQHTYIDLLKAMEINEPWGENNYDPMRVVDGELDNQFSQTATPLSIGVDAPVYP